ncbi:hypothetical protein CNMCM5623_002125 [Aspergillus felis]|uniref:BTB domain-containing protein n=1 Tax=Aspergillus felis TaxID=1287682 RepID=A0A8H6UWD7_9EURO|nr:hypothetical protein CNMCM5623_002125 [Aspergillus felis]
MIRPLGKFALSAGMVHINVGVNETPFDVHVELLCGCSPYFDTLFKDRTEKPIAEDPICFPDDDPDVFAELLGWMYYGDTSADLPSRAGSLFLLQLWVLAGKLKISRLQNHVIHILKTMIDRKPGGIFGSDKVNYVYAHTLPHSPLRLLVVDNWAQNGTKSRLLTRKENFPRPFLEDLCCALVEWKESTTDAVNVIDFAGRYDVESCVPRDIHKELPLRAREYPEPVQSATPEQLKNRKIKQPSSRICQPSLQVESDPRGEVGHEKSHLQIL